MQRFAAVSLILMALSSASVLARERYKDVSRVRPSSPAASEIALGNLYAVVVGVSRYEHPKVPDLKVSHTDAQDFAAFLGSQSKLFRKVHVFLLTNEKATQREVLRLLHYKIKDAGKDDTVVVYLSGHATEDPSNPGEFFFLTYDSDPAFPALSAIHMNRHVGRTMSKGAFNSMFHARPKRCSAAGGRSWNGSAAEATDR